jgi:hypothetical protein
VAAAPAAFLGAAVGALQQAILLDRPFPEERLVAELSRAARCYLTARRPDNRSR